MRYRAFATALLLGGCAAGTAVDPVKVSEFHRGQTTYADVVAALGNPDSTIHNADGTEAVAYSHLSASPFGAKSESYAFVFDQRGVLISDTQSATH